MLVLLQILYHFAVDSLVLEGAVQDDEDLGGDGPVVQIGNVALQNELEGADRADLILVLSIETLKQVYSLQAEKMNKPNLPIDVSLNRHFRAVKLLTDDMLLLGFLGVHVERSFSQALWNRQTCLGIRSCVQVEEAGS